MGWVGFRTLPFPPPHSYTFLLRFLYTVNTPTHTSQPPHSHNPPPHAFHTPHHLHTHCQAEIDKVQKRREEKEAEKQRMEEELVGCCW